MWTYHPPARLLRGTREGEVQERKSVNIFNGPSPALRLAATERTSSLTRHRGRPHSRDATWPPALNSDGCPLVLARGGRSSSSDTVALKWTKYPSLGPAGTQAEVMKKLCSGALGHQEPVPCAVLPPR